MARMSAALRPAIAPLDIEAMAEPVPGAESRSDAELAGSVARAVAEERERVRNWLHDTALQTLEYIAAGGYAPEVSAADLMTVAAHGAADLRASIARPGEGMEGDDLVEGLRVVVEEGERLSAVSVELVVGSTDCSVRGGDAAALVDAAREALTNVRKHAAADRVVVFCEELRGRALVTVKDDGVGFDPLTVTKRLGIRHSIAERMARRGGQALIESRPGEGTLVTLTIGTYLGA